MAFNGDLIVVDPYFWYDIARMKSMEYYNVTNVLNIKFQNMILPIKIHEDELNAIFPPHPFKETDVDVSVVHL